ncbi:lethal (3) 04053 isoform 1-T2 [Glossina fuscipes fuscipes]
MANENDTQQQQQANITECQAEVDGNDDHFKNFTQNADGENKDESSKVKVTHTKDNAENDLPTAAITKLNDLVADLGVSGSRSQLPVGFGDYTNIRATSGPMGVREGLATQLSLDSCQDAINAGTQQSVHQQQPHPTQNSSFSFKHFLSNCSVLTAPSSTVTSLDPSSTDIGNNGTTTITSTMATKSLQTSTGARPKVPQTNLVSSAATSSLSVGGGPDGLNSNASKMKRSPRFSSFDSQASLAEYAGATATYTDLASTADSSTDYRLYPDDREHDGFTDWNLPPTSGSTNTSASDYERGSQYVPRSYSNYDMPRPQTSPRRRIGVGSIRENHRPTRLALNINSTAPGAGGSGNVCSGAKLKLDLPLQQQSTSQSGSVISSGGGILRKNAVSSRPDFPPAALPPGVAAALPDFVQDHWMDSWYSHDMHVNSPPTSPAGGFFSEMTGASGDAGADSDGGVVKLNTENNNRDGPYISALTANSASLSMGLPESNSTVGSKMLPDFLSDGPIIHSSQRLADIATGLPSNTVGSPEEPTISTQLSRLRDDNERLQRELNEMRNALNEQTRRANDLERQLVKQTEKTSEKTQYHNKEGTTTKSCNDEDGESFKKRTSTVHNHVAKLKQQISQLTAEVEMLRREKELMREEGAVGGCSLPNCDRSYAAAATASGGLRNTPAVGIRPSRSQQIARDLQRAATNAESNLRQLLAGVDNLRQMAADIESADIQNDYDASPDLFSDFLDECDDYEEYPGGPAL